MANDFRKTASFYLSKTGNPANTGSKEFPWNSLQKVLENVGGSFALGAGAYLMPRGNVYGYEKGFRSVLIADGLVKILGDPDVRFNPLASNGGFYQDISFEQFGGFIFRYSRYGNPPTFERCIFKVVAAQANVHNSAANEDDAVFNDCIFINLNMDGQPTGVEVGINGQTAAYIGQLAFTRCIFINCRLGENVARVNSCYIDPTSSIKATSATNNNVDPRCIVSEGKGLSVNNAAFSLASPNGISSLPFFNSPANEDFTLRANSPHLTTGIGPAHLRYAQTWIMRSTAAAGQSATTANTWLENTADESRVNLLTCTNFNWSAGQSLYIAENQSGDFSASYRTDSLIFSGNAQELLSLPVISGLNFDSDFPGLESQFNSNLPEVFNNNVPRANVYASGSAGRSPARLTAKYRFSTRIAPRSNVDADWFPNDGTFLEMEISGKPLWNQSTNTGNGSPSFVLAQAQSIVATAMQVEYVAVNNYFSK